VILLYAPQLGQTRRVDDLEHAHFLIFPRYETGETLMGVVEQLLQEIPQETTVWGQQQTRTTQQYRDTLVNTYNKNNRRKPDRVCLDNGIDVLVFGSTDELESPPDGKKTFPLECLGVEGEYGGGDVDEDGVVGVGGGGRCNVPLLADDSSGSESDWLLPPELVAPPLFEYPATNGIQHYTKHCGNGFLLYTEHLPTVGVVGNMDTLGVR